MGAPLSEEKRDELFAAFCSIATVEHVSRMCGVHHATVRRYRQADRWDERLAEVRRQSQEQANHTLAAAMAESLDLVREYKHRFRQALSGKFLASKEVNAAELERIVRLEAFVLGGVESRHQVVAEFAEWSDEELEEFARDGSVPTTARRRPS